MKKAKLKDWDVLVREIESKTCFKLSAGVNDGSAFMVPVDENGIPMGAAMLFILKQLKGMAGLPKRPF